MTTKAPRRTCDGARAATRSHGGLLHRTLRCRPRRPRRLRRPRHISRYRSAVVHRPVPALQQRERHLPSSAHPDHRLPAVPQAKTDIYSKPWTSIDEALDAAATFRHYVEHQDGYTVINRGGGKAFATEKEVQSFFGLLLQRSRFDVNREPNNGRGPVDFAISEGAFDKTLIEFKLAKSSSLKRNLSKQLEIYLEANKTPNGIKAIISYNDADHARASAVLTELGLTNNKYVTIIDARATNKASASTA